MLSEIIKGTVLTLAVMLIFSGCAMQKKGETNTETEPANSTTEVSSEAVTENTTQETTSSEPYYITTKQKIYTHCAITNCIIVEQDGTSMFSYYEKCDACGLVRSNTRICISATVHWTGGFICPNCHETRRVEIETTCN